MMVQKVLHDKREKPTRDQAPSWDRAVFDSIASDALVQKAMLAAFARQLPQLLAVVESRDADDGAWLEAVHKLRGSCAAIGAVRLAQLLAAAEQATAETPAARQARRYELLDEIARLRQELPPG